MAGGKQRKKLAIRGTAADKQMSACDMQAAEAMVVKLVARAFAADHPELFGPNLTRIIGGPIDDMR